MPEAPHPLADLRTRRAPVAPGPATLDRERRTVEVVAATSAPVRMAGPNPAGGFEPWFEMLDMSGADLSRFIGGPVLLDHVPLTSRTVGVVEAAEVRGGQLIARVRLASTPDADDVVVKLGEGVLSAVSVGYRVTRYEAGAARATWVARAWQPLEVSFTPIPADPAARVRSAGSATLAPEEGTMPDHNPPAAPAPDNAVIAERTRIASLDAPAEQARERGMDATSLAALRARAVETGMTAEQFKAALFDAEMKGRAFDAQAREEQKQPGFQPRPVSQYLGSYDDPASIRQRQASAVAAQVLAREPSPEARAFMQYRGPLEMLRAEIGTRNRAAWQWSRDQLAAEVTRSSHTTSDFPSLFTDTMDRVMIGLRDATPQPWRVICASRFVPDFRSFKTVSAAGPTTLAKMVEGAEVTYTTIHTRDEAGQLATYARNVAVTRQALVNDDLGALADAARLFNSGIMQTYRALFTSMFGVNGPGWGPTMGDGNELFSTAHNNVTAGTASTAGVSVLRALLRKQPDVNGNVLGLGPRYLLCGPDSETALAQVVSSTAGGVIAVAENERPVFTDMTVVTEAGLGGAPFFAFADPALSPVLQLVHLTGQDGPRIETFNSGPDRDGVTFRAMLDTAIVAVSWVGAARATGAT